MPTVGIAIPCFIGHIPHLKRLLYSIEAQTRKPDQVIVSCSSSEESDIPYKESDYSFPLKILVTREKKNVAENRNIVSRVITTDVVIFADADDELHPQKVEIVETIFSSMPEMMMLLHSYVVEEFSFEPIKTFSIHKGLSRNATGCVAEYNLPYWPFPLIFYSHLTVSRKILEEMKFNEGIEYKRRDDSVFAGDVAEKYSEYSCFINIPLAKYYPSYTE